MKKKQARKPTAHTAQSPVRVAYLIGKVDRALRKAISGAVQPFGLTLQQYTALSMLDFHERLSNAELAERSLMTPQSANEMVKSMEAKKLIGRRPNPDHGRIIHLQLTAEGKRMLRKADVAVLEIEQCMFGSLSASERRKLREQLKGCLAKLLELTGGNWERR